MKQDGTERIDYAYDENGNLISKVVTKGEKIDRWEYAYDLFNQLEQVKKNGEVVSSYIYDPNGFRVEKVGSKGKIHYVPLLNGEVGYRKEFSTNAEYSFIYVGIQHLARVNGVIGGSGKKFYYHNDHLGSALAVTDEKGNKVVERDFTPFGERINTDVYDDEPRDVEEDDSGFTGKDWDIDAELYYYNARWYDPTVGRFISEDSVADDPTLYVYGANNPIINIDPTGHFTINIGKLTNFVVNKAINYIVSKIPGLSEALAIKNLFVGEGEQDESPKPGDEASTPTQTPPTKSGESQGTVYIGEKPEGEPIRYEEFPSGLKIPVYSLDQIPESERWKYVNQIDPDDRTIMYVPPGMEDMKVSENFKVREFMSDVAKKENGEFVKNTDGRVVSAGKDRFIRLDAKLVTELEIIRAENGGNPMIITEGFRSIEWQEALTASGWDTAGYSPHTAGIAVDFKIKGVEASTIQNRIIARISNKAGTGRIGLGKSFTHFDIADTVYGKSWKLPDGRFAPYSTGQTWTYSY